MDVVLVQAGVVAVALELDLELHLGRPHRQVADRAWRADARTTPRAVGGARRGACRSQSPRAPSRARARGSARVPRSGCGRAAWDGPPSVNSQSGAMARY